jgi:hypothetical protein
MVRRVGEGVVENGRRVHGAEVLGAWPGCLGPNLVWRLMLLTGRTVALFQWAGPANFFQIFTVPPIIQNLNVQNLTFLMSINFQT